MLYLATKVSPVGIVPIFLFRPFTAAITAELILIIIDNLKCCCSMGPIEGSHNPGRNREGGEALTHIPPQVCNKITSSVSVTDVKHYLMLKHRRFTVETKQWQQQQHKQSSSGPASSRGSLLKPLFFYYFKLGQIIFGLASTSNKDSFYIIW